MSERDAAAGDEPGEHHPLADALHETEREARERGSLLTAKEPPSLMEAMGGPRGMTESAAPTLAFVIATTAGAEVKPPPSSRSRWPWSRAPRAWCAATRRCSRSSA